MLLSDKDEQPHSYPRRLKAVEDYEHLDLYEIRVERLWRDYLAERNRFAIGEEAVGILIAIEGDKWAALGFFIRAAGMSGQVYAAVLFALALACGVAFWLGMRG